MTAEPIKAQAFTMVFDQDVVNVVNLMMSAVDGDDRDIKAKWLRSLQHHNIVEEYFRFSDEFDDKVHELEMCPDQHCGRGKSKQENPKLPAQKKQKKLDKTRIEVRELYGELSPTDRRTTMLADYVMELMEQDLIPSNSSNVQIAAQMTKDLLEIKNTA